MSPPRLTEDERDALGDALLRKLPSLVESVSSLADSLGRLAAAQERCAASMEEFVQARRKTSRQRSHESTPSRRGVGLGHAGGPG